MSLSRRLAQKGLTMQTTTERAAKHPAGEFTVTIRTSCERCAFALAGHVPALGTIRSVVVTTERRDGSILTLHCNNPTLKAHDGSPLACAEHGVTVHLAHEPPTPTRAPASLRPEQQARRVDQTAYALHVILDEARAERETAALVHAVASAVDREEALRLSVAASSAVDVALQALTSYVVHGFYQPREVAEAEDDLLHERCRIARNTVARKIVVALRSALGRTFSGGLRDSQRGMLDGIEAEHMALCHSDGSVHEDGCDKAPVSP